MTVPLINGMGRAQDFGKLVMTAQGEYAMVFNTAVELGKTSAVYTKLLNDHQIDGLNEVIGVTSGVGYLDDYTYGDDIPAGSKTVPTDVIAKATPFAKSLTVTKEALLSGKYKKEIQNMNDLVRSVFVTKELIATAVYNNAFSTGNTVTVAWRVLSVFKPASKALISTLHETVNGTQSNADAAGSVLSPTSLAAAKTNIMSQTDKDGTSLFINGMNLQLVVPTGLFDLATRIVNSAKLQGTNNNDVNTLTGIEVIQHPNLSSSTAWFLQDKNAHGLKFATSIQENYESDYVKLKQALIIMVTGKWGSGWIHPFGIYGSKGDGQVYNG